MGLFDAKYCDICGEKISLMGNRKLSDGNMCKNCSAKLSPFLSDRRHTTLDDIKRHLEYREQNKQNVSMFNPTIVLGNNTKVYVDQNTGTFTVSSSKDWRSTNPDIINLSQVSSVYTEPEEHKREIYRKDSEGHNVSYNPKRYEYSYEFKTTINVNSPYFDEIKFELTTPSTRPTNMNDMSYRNFEQQAMQIQQALTGMSGGMGMNQGMGMNGMNQGMGMNGMNGMGMNGMNQGMGMNGMNQGMGMNGMNQGMGMNGMNQGMGMNGMNQGMGMNGMNGMGNAGLGNRVGGALGGIAGGLMGQVINAAEQGLAGNDVVSQGLNQQAMNQQGMNGMNQGMGMNGMNQGMGMNGMNQGMGMNGMNQGMGMNGMNQGMGMNGMNQGMGMNGMNGMNQGMGMNGMNQGMGMNAPQMQAGGGTWVCDCCGTTNTGAICEGCSNPRPM